MFYVITNRGVIKGLTLKDVNIKMKTAFEISDFKVVGRDYIIKVTSQDIDFVQDKKRMSQIPIRNLYKADITKLLIYFMLFLQFILLVKK